MPQMIVNEQAQNPHTSNNGHDRAVRLKDAKQEKQAKYHDGQSVASVVESMVEELNGKADNGWRTTGSGINVVFLQHGVEIAQIVNNVVHSIGGYKIFPATGPLAAKSNGQITKVTQAILDHQHTKAPLEKAATQGHLNSLIAVLEAETESQWDTWNRDDDTHLRTERKTYFRLDSENGTLHEHAGEQNELGPIDGAHLRIPKLIESFISQ